MSEKNGGKVQMYSKKMSKTYSTKKRSKLNSKNIQEKKSTINSKKYKISIVKYVRNQ